MRTWGFRRRLSGYGRFRGPARVPEPDRGYLSMADAVPGKKYTVTGINGGYMLNSRLCAMGFVPGETFYVSGAFRGGSRCVVIKGTKFAICRRMAERIQVREI
jgi:Fe2+ transport system protein FeoA